MGPLITWSVGMEPTDTPMGEVQQPPLAMLLPPPLQSDTVHLLLITVQPPPLQDTMPLPLAMEQLISLLMTMGQLVMAKRAVSTLLPFSFLS